MSKKQKTKDVSGCLSGAVRAPRIPAYRLKTVRGKAKAVVTLGRKDYYLGDYGTKESREAYIRLLGRWESVGRTHLPEPGRTPIVGFTITQLCDAYWHANPSSGGPAASERHAYRSVIKIWREVAPGMAVAEFGPMQLCEVRDAMIKAGWNRNNINRQIVRLKHIIRYGESKGLVPAGAWATLRTVEGIKPSDGAAEPRKIKPADIGDVRAARTELPKTLAAVVDIQLLTGMRPGEVLSLKWSMIDRSDEIWVVNLETHKTAWRGKERTILLGPLAQSVLAPYQLRGQDDYIFQYEGERYHERGYAQAINRACKRAGVKHWHPSQLRKNAASAIRKLYGLEAARALLGHASASLTDAIYADRDVDVLKRIASEIG